MIVRSVCCLLIINTHTGMLSIPILEKFAKGGFVLNVIFITLSGYFLALGFNRVITSEYSLLTWYKRRLLKIIPPLITSIFLFSFVFYALSINLNLKEVLLSLTGLGYFFNSIPFGIHLWFVSVILICYLFFPLSYWLIKNSKIISVFILVGSLLFLSLLHPDIYSKISGEVFFRFIYHFVVFQFAVYLGIYHDRIDLLSILSFASIIIAVEYLTGYAGFKIIVPLAISTLIVFFINVTSNVRFSMRGVGLINSISYEIYIVHYPILLILVKTNFVGKPIGYGIVFIMSILIAYIVKKFNDKLFLVNSPWFKKALAK
ncbi:hypothetical protein C9J01_08310 [Photobacterium rosenbergii]|uniref:Acyltransferase 3 domain-containing protein n=2 Tax=Photobacterium rosenbergii TaxID=294936 RepID=A0A2T3NHG1_9GAMM|nr:hypothetical protein C9J01_08310 [Photobacterium rosenbergii]